MIKIFTLIAISTFTTFILGQNQKSNYNDQIKISFNSLLDEDKWEYRSDGNKIKVFVKNETSDILKSTIKLSTDSIKKFHLILSEVIERIPLDTTYLNPAILDGYIWDVELEENSIKKHFQVINRYNEDLDKIILFLNNNLKKKYRGIYPSSLFFKK